MIYTELKNDLQEIEFGRVKRAIYQAPLYHNSIFIFVVLGVCAAFDL